MPGNVAGEVYLEMEDTITALIAKAPRWRDEMLELRRIVLATGLAEEMKWRQPVYTLDGSNLLIIGAFKHYVALGFFKGVLLKDTRKLLHTPGANTQSSRLFKFTSVDEILKHERVITSYIKEAIRAEKAGLKVTFKTINEHTVPDELTAAFKKDPALKKAFDALTPGRRRAYLIHFSSAKQSATRAARIQKLSTKIKNGKGLNDYP